MASARKIPTKIYDIQAHTSKVTCLDIGQKGPVLVTGGLDRNVNLWTFGITSCFMTLSGHNAAIDCVKFAYSDDYVYSADDSGVIKRWDLMANRECTTFFGHMKAVRTLDLHPTNSEYFVSGSNDTTIALWDVRQKKSMKKYRGHISNVNSVKFSPDGMWIASAGTEGCIIIWDIRMSKQILEFTERESPAMCVQYHPEHFLMAAGRNDGTVDLYDLEEKKLITRIDKGHFKGHAVKCLTFDESGGCLFVGTAAGISVIGWEPDEEFDHIESTWSLLGDMKILSNKLYCGAYENRNVAIHELSLNQVMPFYNPSNHSFNNSFNHNQSSRKSFSRGNGKVRLSIGSKMNPKDCHENGGNGGGLSPNLSIEMIDEEDMNQLDQIKYTDACSFDFNQHYPVSNGPYEHPRAIKLATTSPHLVNSNAFVKEEMKTFNLENFECDLDYYPCKNITADPEKEDFPVNNAQPPDYAPKLSTSTTITKTVVSRQKLESHQQRRPSPPSIIVKPGSIRKLSTSRSTLELNKLSQEDHVIFKKPISRGSSPIRNLNNMSNKIRKSESSAQINSMKSTNSNRYSHHGSNNFKVEFVTKQPVRSKTVFDMKASTHTSSTISTSGMTAPSPIIRYSNETSNEEYEIQALMNEHDNVHPKLCNRAAHLGFIRSSTQKGEVSLALRSTILNDEYILVDLLGAILEQTSTMNLDMCVLLLPKIYELLQSEVKFHCVRACDTLREILSKFLSLIRENTDSYGMCVLGVDVTREERQQKCMECRSWLLKIRCLPENQTMGKNLQQLQNMIVDI